MMDEVPANRQPFPGQGAGAWIDAYQEEMLQARDEATIETYTRILEKFTAWLALRPQAITRTAIEGFLETLPSYSYKKQARAALCGFCRWLQEDQQLLERNPIRGVSIPAQALLAPLELSEDQRYMIRDLVEREADVRGKAAFALGYWAGCRVSDVFWLLLDQVHMSRKAGWMTVGHKGGKERTIDRGRIRHAAHCMTTSSRVAQSERLRFYEPAREKARERRGSRWMEVDGGWHPPMVTAAQSEGTPCRSQIHQRP